MSRMARHATICLMNAPDLLSQALRKARALLEGETPLNRDCGGLCGAACCQPDEDGLGGMLLFPGEAAFYHPMPEGFQIEREDSVVPGGQLLTCEGRCQRQDRPLACRLFPWRSCWRRAGNRSLQPDPRWPLCPLDALGDDGAVSGLCAGGAGGGKGAFPGARGPRVPDPANGVSERPDQAIVGGGGGIMIWQRAECYREINDRTGARRLPAAGGCHPDGAERFSARPSASTWIRPG